MATSREGLKCSNIPSAKEKARRIACTQGHRRYDVSRKPRAESCFKHKGRVTGDAAFTDPPMNHPRPND